MYKVSWRKIFLPVMAVLLVQSAWANVTLPKFFGHHMVLQRNVPIPVWGTAAADEEVKVTFNKQTVSAKAGNDGKWKVELPKMTAGGPYQLLVAGNDNRLLLKDVMVGEVWLCSGQSNMEFPVRLSTNQEDAAKEGQNKDLRYITVARNWQVKPVDDIRKGVWVVNDPTRAGWLSAVAFFFGSRLQQELKVPVGLISVSWGGSRIEAWTPLFGLESKPSLSKIVDTAKNHLVTDPKAPKPKKKFCQPTVLYNGMINPLVPYAIRGAIWYQGEGNRGDGMLYVDEMEALVGSWRKLWNNPDMPFYFVQIAPFNYRWGKPDDILGIWEAQSIAEKRINNSAMAVINDLGSLKTIHPTNKAPVGRRLADIALNKTYGMKNIPCGYPTFSGMKISGYQAIVSFEHSDGLKTRDGKSPDWFELCGKDDVYHTADAVIKDNTIILTSPEVKDPAGVRFAWSQLATPNLINGAGLPAGAFHFKMK